MCRFIVFTKPPEQLYIFVQTGILTDWRRTLRRGRKPRSRGGLSGCEPSSQPLNVQSARAAANMSESASSLLLPPGLPRLKKSAVQDHFLLADCWVQCACVYARLNVCVVHVCFPCACMLVSNLAPIVACFAPLFLPPLS